MNRLSVRLSLTIVFVIVLTVSINTMVQVYSINRVRALLPPELRREALIQPLPQALGLPAPLTESKIRTLGVDNAFVRRFVYRRMEELGFAVGLSLLLGIPLARLLARRIAAPIERVSAAAARVASGDLSTRVEAETGVNPVDEIAHLAASFNHMAGQLEQLEQERKALIADIAHELRTPLTAMRGRLEAMEDGIAVLGLGEVHRLHAQVLLLSRLVEDLRTLTLADAGRLSLYRRDIDLAEIARQVVQIFTPQAAKRGLELHLSARGPVLARLDADRSAQVLTNLLENALRYTPQGGSVEVHLEDRDNTALLQVADTGPGIPEDALSHVFDRFYRPGEARDRGSGGSGLGLAIVHSLVELQGGTVRAYNQPEGGAVIEVRFPGGSG